MIDPDLLRPDKHEPLTKVLPTDTGPLVSTWWICPVCRFERKGGPPATCGSDNPDCPIQ